MHTERDFTFGSLRLVLQTALFFLLVCAFLVSTDEVALLGINRAIDTSLEYEALRGVTTREILAHETIPAIAAASKSHFVLSSIYYDDLERVRA
jgi:hypothetical protein